MNAIRLVIPAVLLALLIPAGPVPLKARDVRVLVWDEQQPQQRPAYSNFLGNAIGSFLGKQPGLKVTSARLEDPGQGLASLDQCDVLVWWGHVRNREIGAQTGRDIVQRIRDGKLSLIALHSAHWSTPFIEAMKERAREDALQPLSPAQRAGAILVETNRYPQIYTAPRADDFITPYAWYQKSPDGRVRITLAIPNCCFPAYRPDGKPSQVRTLLPSHPIARHVPREFVIPQTEMYNEPFHVPAPDQVIFEERWAPGEWFRSGSVWQLGRGKVFYFRPGHEVYPVYQQPECLQVVLNAVRWLAGGGAMRPGSAR